MRRSNLWLPALLLLPACQAYQPAPVTSVTTRSLVILRAPTPFTISFRDSIRTSHECEVLEVRGEARPPVGDTLHFAEFTARGQPGMPESCRKGYDARVMRTSDSNIALTRKQFSARHTWALLIPLSLLAALVITAFAGLAYIPAY